MAQQQNARTSYSAADVDDALLARDYQRSCAADRDVAQQAAVSDGRVFSSENYPALDIEDWVGGADHEMIALEAARVRRGLELLGAAKLCHGPRRPASDGNAPAPSAALGETVLRHFNSEPRDGTKDFQHTVQRFGLCPR